MLASIGSLKAKLGITGNEENDLLGAILGRSDAVAKRMMNREVEAADYTEITDGHGEQIIQLKHFPVISLASFEFRDAPTDTWNTAHPSEYSLKRETGEIRFPNLRLTRGFENIRIVYRA
jgi:hypothetical protein